MSTNEKSSNEECTSTEPKTLKEALQLLREDAHAKGTDKMTMEEIIEEIAGIAGENREQENRS